MIKITIIQITIIKTTKTKHNTNINKNKIKPLRAHVSTTLYFFILGIIYLLLVGFPITLCRVELHFGSWLLVPILGLSLYLTISPSFISGCFLFFLAAF